MALSLAASSTSSWPGAYCQMSGRPSPRRWNSSLIGSTTSRMNAFTLLSSGSAFSDIRRSLSSSCGLSLKLDLRPALVWSVVSLIGSLPRAIVWRAVLARIGRSSRQGLIGFARIDPRRASTNAFQMVSRDASTAKAQAATSRAPCAGRGTAGRRRPARRPPGRRPRARPRRRAAGPSPARPARCSPTAQATLKATSAQTAGARQGGPGGEPGQAGPHRRRGTGRRAASAPATRPSGSASQPAVEGERSAASRRRRRRRGR